MVSMVWVVEKKRLLFLDSCMQFVKGFDFDACKLLNADAFIFINELFEPNVHYCANTLKIVKKPYLDYCSRKYSKWLCIWKLLLHFLKKFWNDKYPHEDFEFYLSHHAQNVHMGLNYSLLMLHEYEQIISDIEELWLIKTHNMKFKFMLPHLIHIVKWKFEYIIFSKITENGNNWMQNIF